MTVFSMVDRAKSFRFFGVTPKSEKNRDSDDMDESNATTEQSIGAADRASSLGQRQQTRRARQASASKSAEQRLRELFLKVPKDLDVEEMRDAIEEAKKAGVEVGFIDRCRLNMEEAERIFAKKREAERLAAMKERCEEVTTQLELLLKFEPLTVDEEALKLALEMSAKLDEEEGPHKVSPKLAAEGHEFLAAAAAAHAARRQAALDALKDASACLLTVDPDTLRHACEAAKEAGVDKEVLKVGHDLLREAEVRNHKAHKLSSLAAHDEADLKIDALRDAWVGASSAGASATTLAEAHAKLRAAEAAQAERSIASARLTGLLDVSAATLDVDAVREAKGSAEEAGALAALLSKADHALEGASRAQHLRDAATASLLVLAAPRAPERSDIATLKELLPKAPNASVAEDVVTMAKASLQEAEAAQAEHTDDNHKAHIARLKAANRRTAETAPERKRALERTATAAEESVAKTAAVSASRKEAHAAAAKAAEAAMAKVVKADKEIGALEGSAQASAWEKDKALRTAMIDAEAAATHAHADLEVAMLVEAEARWQAGKARRAVEMYADIADVLAASQAPEPEPVPVETVALTLETEAKKPKKKGGGGCCGGGKRGDVLDPAEAMPMEPAPPPKDPLPMLADEMAWSPLKLPTGSTHQVELLLAFALGGLYSNERICAAVASAVCASDPTFSSSSSFVLRLTEAFTVGHVTLKAGGAAKERRHSESGGGIARRISHMLTPRAESPRISENSPETAGAGNATPRGDSRRDSNSGTLSRSVSKREDDEPLARSGSSFNPFRGSRSRSASGSNNGDVSIWVGREVQSEITKEQFKAMLELWLAKMARGSQRKAKKAPPKGSAAKGKGSDAASVGKLSMTIAELLKPPHSERLEAANLGFSAVLPPLLQRHFEVTEGKSDEGDEGDEEAQEAAAALADVHACIELLLGAAMKDEVQFGKVVTLFSTGPTGTNPPAALAGVARAFAARLAADIDGYKARLTRPAAERFDDLAHERVVLALARLFVTKPEKLTGFQQLVPTVFDAQLALGAPLRDDMCTRFKQGGMSDDLVERIRTDDELVRQQFFWSAPGMKLFGGAADLRDPIKLKQLLKDALSQQAIIASAFLEETIRRAAKDKAQADLLPPLVKTTLECLLEHVAHEGGPDKVRRGVLLACDTILYASAKYSSELFAAVYPTLLPAWSENENSTQLLDFYVREHLKPRLDKGGEKRTASDRDQGIIQTLCSLFIDKPSKLTAFVQLTPDVFDDLLALGSDARGKVNNVLLSGSFEPRLKALLADSDDFVKSSFFWAADGAMALCMQARVAKDYKKLNSATLMGKDGKQIHLFSRLLALLLRLSSHRGGEIGEIAFRTQEVLDQFERNPEQQAFMLTIIEKLDERSIATPDAFTEIALTVLSEVAANGVQTISSVQGDGLSLCEQAMTTLLQSYVAERPPSEWKGLFKEATNIAFMVKYMFRESLDLAKEKFREAIGKKGATFAGDAHDVVSKLVQETMSAYGEVGIYDPERLAEIDFLNRPEQLVELVAQSKNRVSRAQKADMQLLTEVTSQWMQLMVDKKYPPLTPHHTQAFTVLMMCKFFQTQILDTPSKKQKARYKAFIAQLSTGEGKSIVIAMLAIFMVKLYGMRVHVLENNAGLLQRDFAQNKPFFEKFGIKCSHNLDDEEAQIMYCLKDAINRRFLRKLVEGKLDEELGKTVLIVDEVDDLIVNERPNSHYVKKDAEKSPALKRCYELLKNGNQVQPDNVDNDTWDYAMAVAEFCKTKSRDKHYRVVKTKNGGEAVMMLDADGNLPKVALTAPWLAYLNYTLCHIEPFSETRYATVCTPYIFNKYKGIFGLTGSVGGKAELQYLAKTYKAIKFDVPRFLDTCGGNARKEVVNHGVEVLAGEEAQIDRVCQIAGKHFKDVPVLVICSSLSQLQKVYDSLSKGDGKYGIPPKEVQRFAQFSTDGRSLAREWQTVIDDATKRFGNAHESRCRVTITDKFGGRGHDFQVIDKESNANGGMLVIATSIPDEREWIQWKGRTARQDRPGQFYVVLNDKVKPFDDPKHKKLKERLKKLAPSGGSSSAEEYQKVEALLEISDEGINDRLKAFELEQAQGEKLNELTEKYYKRHQRGFDDPWPNKQFLQSDSTLRKMLTSFTEIKPAEIVKMAKAELQIDLDS